MSDAVMTIAGLKTLCCRVAAPGKAANGDFGPTANQIYFFMLVWLLKQKVTFQQADDYLDDQNTEELLHRAQQVATHLDAWGATVAELKRREAKEWELLRIQMEKAISYYYCHDQVVKADALQEALLKIFRLLDKMIGGHKLNETEDMVSFVVNARADLTNIYDFGSPFYAFAKRIARNELITQLRKESRHPIYPIPLEDMGFALPMVPAPALTEDEHALAKAQILQLKIDLARLLQLIQSGLTLKPRQVVHQTLAVQPQFWQALTITGLSAPGDFPPPSALSSDLEIATALEMTENSVRAHRSQAKKRIQEIDPMAGLLLNGLINRRGGGSKPEPEE
jgi:DNA-directed RNA polymerase specialized sigma24 family protein